MKSKGCIGISEKCVFTLKSLICQVATGSNLSGFIRAIVVLQVFFLNLISFQKNATRRTVGGSRAEVFSLKKKQESPMGIFTSLSDPPHL